MSCSGDKHASSDSGTDPVCGAGASEAKFHEFLEGNQTIVTALRR